MCACVHVCARVCVCMRVLYMWKPDVNIKCFPLSQSTLFFETILSLSLAHTDWLDELVTDPRDLFLSPPNTGVMEECCHNWDFTEVLVTQTQDKVLMLAQQVTQGTIFPSPNVVKIITSQWFLFSCVLSALFLAVLGTETRAPRTRGNPFTTKLQLQA